MTEHDSSIGSDWVSETALRAFALDNPLIDWLDLYGEARERGVPMTDLPLTRSRPTTRWTAK
jgi:hypothetical protein